MSFLEANEGPIRLAVFGGAFFLFALLEHIRPRRTRVLPRLHRWATNWGLVVTYTVMMRVFIPILAVGFASTIDANSWGLFALVHLPGGFEIILAILVLDLLIYAQHVATHHIPILWRIHKVHHSDRDVDVTTAIRFHPLEIVLSMGYKLACIALVGPAALAVLLFEIILNASAMFNHANIALPGWLDRALRIWLITPDTHRIHHSVHKAETNSNYGFFLSFWDQLFGTFTDAPRDGHANMEIGLAEHQTEKPASALWCLILPFLKPEPSKPAQR